ncbi:hypothetical protein CHUAL_013329 [Chamberlinius hualienensis]
MNFARVYSTVFRNGVRNFAVESSSATAGEPGGMKMWRNLTFLVAVPGVLVCMLNAYLKELEHLKHPHRAAFVPYEHLRIRNKKFPWGDGNHSLFHNPEKNALPNGYETPDPVAHH